MDISGLRAAYEGHTPTLMGERGGSAVLVPLVRQNGEYCLLYEIRSAAVRQPGEVCFPGGKRENGETAVQCALRETREELADTFLLPLRELRAHPPEMYAYQQPVAIPDFPYADAGVAADYPWRPCRIEVPVYRGLPHPLWGITARITMDVVDKL